MNQVMEMEEFIEKSKGMLSGVLSNLGWTKSSICTKGMSKMVVCPLDESHVIPEKSVQKHINKCRLSKEQLLPKAWLIVKFQDVALTAMNLTDSEEHNSADEDSDSELSF